MPAPPGRRFPRCEPLPRQAAPDPCLGRLAEGCDPLLGGEVGKVVFHGRLLSVSLDALGSSPLTAQDLPGERAALDEREYQHDA